MIYAYLIEHNEGLAKVRSLESTLRAKQPDAGYFVVDEENLSLSLIHELTESQGLFAKRYLVRVEGNFSSAEHKEVIKKAIPLMAESENVFIVLSEQVDSATKKLLATHAEKVLEPKKALDDVKEKQSGNLFRLTDAFGDRNTNRMWSLYREAKENGASDEEIHGLLCWQYRQMLFATKESSAENAGMKSFIYTKVTRQARNFSAAELVHIGTTLTAMNHDDRRGLRDLATSLELFTLTLR